LAGSLVGELAQCDTNLHAKLFHVPHDIENGFELGLAFADPPPSSPHAETACACGFCFPSFKQNGISPQQSLGFDSSVVASALGAVAAVFTATTRFDAEQAAELNPLIFTPVLAMHPARLVEEGKKRLMINRGQLGKCFWGDFANANHRNMLGKAGEKVKI
jgi:hypothetical protein